MWLVVFSLVSLILAYNTLVAIFWLFFIVFTFCILLVFLRVEFLAYLFILIYLGGILIFFLFSTFMLNLNFNPYPSNFSLTFFAWLSFPFIIFVSKFVFLILSLSEVISLVGGLLSLQYLPFLNLLGPTESVFFGRDAYIFLHLYEAKWLYLILVGFMLFFIIFGVITICHKKCIVI